MTQNAKHAPGPYSVGKINSALIVRDATGRRIAQVSSGKSLPTQEEEHTAALFEAAPELLEALKALTAYAEARADLDEDDYSSEGKASFAAARAALAKAGVKP